MPSLPDSHGAEIAGIFRSFNENRPACEDTDTGTPTFELTMKYTHIGLQDQADTLAGLPLTKGCTNADWTGIGRISGGVLGQEVSAGDSEGDCEDEPENEKPLPGKGFRRVVSVPVRISQLA